MTHLGRACAAKGLGVRVSLLPRVLDVVGSSVVFDQLDGMTVLGVRRFGMTRSSRIAKRAFDLAGAGLLLLAVGPLMALIALAIRLDSRGPVFFRQTRVGRGGKPFDILKFRTMRPTRSPGPLITGAGDPRVTRVGRVLRRWKVDELPQLVNVLRGEMSFVGPRPEVPRYVNMFAEQYRELLAVRPGITDIASMAFRDEETLLGRSSNPEDLYVREILPRKLALSHAYVRRRSFGLDLRLIARTVAAILGWPRTGEETT